MRPERATDHIWDFVEELLRTGIMLSDLLANLLESIPEDAFPGESNGDVVLEMLIGTIRPVARAAGRESVLSATALIVDSRARTLKDLQRAADLAGGGEPEAAPERHDRQLG
jgi:hypothetical protein